MEKSKKDFVAKTFSNLGILKLLEQFADKPSLISIGYHRIGGGNNAGFDNRLFSATEDEFGKQVEYLGKHFNVVNAEQLNKEITEPTAMITFDDGYRDNYTAAFPILKSLGETATFFIPTNYIDNPKLSWWDHIAYVVKNSALESISLEYPQKINIDIQRDKESAIKKILHVFKRAEKIDENYLLSHLEEQAQVKVDSEALGRELFMNWEQIEEMHNAGMAIGSHTHTHRILNQLSGKEQEFELKKSKQILESKLNSSICSIAFPVGNTDSYSDQTKLIAEQAGYKKAFSCHGGVDYSDDMDIQRFSIDLNVSFPMFRTRILLNHLFGSSLC